MTPVPLPLLGSAIHDAIVDSCPRSEDITRDVAPSYRVHSVHASSCRGNNELKKEQNDESVCVYIESDLNRDAMSANLFCSPAMFKQTRGLARRMCWRSAKALMRKAPAFDDAFSLLVHATVEELSQKMLTWALVRSGTVFSSTSH